MLRKLILAIAILSLAACQTTESKQLQITELVNMKGLDIDAKFEKFLDIKDRSTNGKLVELSYILKICNSIIPGQTDMRQIIAKNGLPDWWLNNGGGIETAGWDAIYDNSLVKFMIFYARSGTIRNATGFRMKPSTRAIFGVSKNSTAQNKCLVDQ